VGSIWHTSNGGATWVKQALPQGTSILNHIQFIDALQGWAVGIRYTGEDFSGPLHRLAVYHTVDGGGSWQLQYAPDIEFTLTGVNFIDAKRGWAVGFHFGSSGYGGSVFHTADGGVTWERQGPEDLTLWDVQFIDQNRGYAVGTDYISAFGAPVIRTLDGGATWEKVRQKYNESDGLFAVSVTADRVISVGDHDFAILSTDPWGVYGTGWGEQLFTQKYLNTHYTWFDIAAVDETHIWAVGSRYVSPSQVGQAIMASSDGGASWQIQYQHESAYDPFYWNSYTYLSAVFFTDTQNGWAVGKPDDTYHYAILHTSDGGKNWVEQGYDLHQGTDWGFKDVQFFDSQHGWASIGLLTGSSNGNTFLARTDDGGNHWSWVDTGLGNASPTWGAMSFTDPQHGWVVIDMGVAARTTDGGKTWTRQTVCNLCRTFGMAFRDTQNGWVVGEGQYSTSDGGDHYNQQDLGMGADVRGIDFVDSLHGWMAGESGGVLYTADGGQSWRFALDYPYGVDLWGLDFASPQVGWIGGDYGMILTTVQVPYSEIYLPLVKR
jgi:photosystem II stability/assembly factor-like uncharacterized protein